MKSMTSTRVRLVLVLTTILMATSSPGASGLIAPLAIPPPGGDGCITGWTVYDEFGNPSARYDARGRLVEKFIYDDFGFLIEIEEYEEDPKTGEPVMSFRTIVDSFGRRDKRYNREGDLIRQYVYGSQGMLTEIHSYGQRPDT
ncbi:MAG: hypothetical protein ACE5E0_02965, partial [Terriglobia bacterium]